MLLAMRVTAKVALPMTATPTPPVVAMEAPAKAFNVTRGCLKHSNSFLILLSNKIADSLSKIFGKKCGLW